MPLQILFDADDHTAADGPYVRVVKTRKWLYLGAGSLLLVTRGWFDPAAATKLVGEVVTLSRELLIPPLALGLAYLVVQYVMLVWQLLVTYDLVLKERLAFRQQDQLSAARDRAQAAREEASKVFAGLAADGRKQMSRLEEELRRVEAQLKQFPDPDEDLSAANALDRDEMRVRNGLLQELSQVTTARQQQSVAMSALEHHPAFVEARHLAVDAEKAFEVLAQENPAHRAGYRRLERAIDALRIFPPLVLASIALGSALRIIL